MSNNRSFLNHSNFNCSNMNHCQVVEEPVCETAGDPGKNHHRKRIWIYTAIGLTGLFGIFRISVCLLMK